MEDMARKIDAHDVADWFINRIDRRMGEVITTDVVHRLLYFAQAWYLANTGHEMFEEEFEAWGTGPIIPAIYERFERMDVASLPDIENSRTIKGSKLEMLECIQRDYGCYMPFKLDELAKEWASVEYRNGRGFYDHVGGNRAHISRTEAWEILQGIKRTWQSAGYMP